MVAVAVAAVVNANARAIPITPVAVVEAVGRVEDHQRLALEVLRPLEASTTEPGRLELLGVDQQPGLAGPRG